MYAENTGHIQQYQQTKHVSKKSEPHTKPESHWGQIHSSVVGMHE